VELPRYLGQGAGDRCHWVACQLDGDFPWTKLAHAPAPEGVKPIPDVALTKIAPPQIVRKILGDGSFRGAWQRSDDEMAALWAAGVADIRAMLHGPWPDQMAHKDAAQ